MKDQKNSAIVVVNPEIAESVSAPVDPDAVARIFDVAGTKAPVTHGQASRGAAAELRRNIGAIIRGERYAAAIADGLCSLSEVDTVSPRKLDVMIAMRRRGDSPKVAKA